MPTTWNFRAGSRIVSLELVVRNFFSARAVNERVNLTGNDEARWYPALRIQSLQICGTLLSVYVSGHRWAKERWFRPSRPEKDLGELSAFRVWNGVNDFATQATRNSGKARSTIKQ